MVKLELALVCFVVSIAAQPPAENKTCFQGNIKKANDCCPLPRLLNKSIADKCNKENKDTSPRVPPGVRKTEGSCVTECIFRTIKAYNVSSNTLDKEAVRKAILEIAGHDEAFGPMFNKTIDDCHSQIMKDPVFSAKPVSPLPIREGCTFLAPALMNCIKIELFSKCPDKHWSESAECDQLKKKLSTGCSYSSIVG